MHKKIKILLASLSICFMFLLNTSSVFGASCSITNPSEPSATDFGNLNKSDYPYYLVINNCFNSSSKVAFAYSSTPFTVSSVNDRYFATYDGPYFVAQSDASNTSYQSFVQYKPSDIYLSDFTVANHTILNSDGTNFFHVPWVTTDAFRPVGERILEATPIIVGLTAFCLALVTCLVVLVKHLRKSARV